MGMIVVTTKGSFGSSEKSFSAQAHGHADAVAEAIEYIAAELLPKATADDHDLHERGSKPSGGFER